MSLLARAAIVWGMALAAAPLWAQLEDWQRKALEELSLRYLSEAAGDQEEAGLLNRIFQNVGGKLAAGGTSAVPAEDLAMLALLQTRLAAAVPAPRPPLPVPDPAKTAPSPTQATPAVRQPAITDVSKGYEGLRQAQDRLDELPLSERMVITGDMAAAIQGAQIPGTSHLSSTIGRARVNFVLRAFTADPARGLGPGYFFVQMRAAGGASDPSAVGGPSSFTALNGIASDRSQFNEGTSRGNIYLAKAFYEQRLELGDNWLNGRAGIINLSDFFDTNLFANNEARQFLNGAFVNSPAYKTGISAPGFMGEYYRRMRRDWLEGLVVRGGYAVSRTERAFTSPIWNGEVEAQTIWNGYRGHWRVGGSIGNRAGEGGVRGLHISMDHWVAPRIGVFGRYALSNAGPGSFSFGVPRQSYSGGLQVRFAGTGNAISAWSAGFSQAFGIQTEDVMASERVFETYYRWQWNENISLSPDLQLVLGSGGRRSRGTHAVFGLRVHFGF